MKKGLLNQLDAGLLGEGCGDQDTEVLDGETVLEEIASGNEDIIPDDYVELDGDMKVVENISDAIEQEEVIMEEVETPLLEEGTESDFSKATVAMLATSNMRLNNLMGVDEDKGCPVAGLQSNVHGGYKAAFQAGLEAKEGFLKNLKTKAAAGFKAMLDAIKKFIQKAIIFFNGAKSSSDKIAKVLKGKTNATVADKKLTEEDKKAIAAKFGAWIALGGKVSNYSNYASELLNPAVPEADKKVPLRDAKISSMPLAVSKGLNLGTKDQWSILNLSGQSGKFLVLSTGKFEGRTMPKTAQISLALAGSEIDAIEVREFKASIEAKDVTETEVPSIAELTKMNEQVSEMAGKLKTSANANYAAAESFAKAIAAAKEGEEDKVGALDRVSKVATRCALENVSAYMTAMKTMLWYSSTFAKKYKEEAAK